MASKDSVSGSCLCGGKGSLPLRLDTLAWSADDDRTMVGEGESFEGAEVGRLRRLSGVVVILAVVRWCVEERVV